MGARPTRAIRPGPEDAGGNAVGMDASPLKVGVHRQIALRMPFPTPEHVACAANSRHPAISWLRLPIHLDCRVGWRPKPEIPARKGDDVSGRGLRGS